MAGYIGSKSSVTQVDGYSEAEADAEFVNDPNGAITVSGSNVGIGTDSPSHKLDIVGSSENLLELTSSGSFGTAINITQNTPSTSILVNSTSTGDIIDLRDSGATVFTVKDGGNVGIGTSSPSATLQVVGTTNSLQSVFGSDSSGLKISTFQKTANDAGVILDAQESSNGTLTFATTGTERMRIDSLGHVLVGASAFNGSTECSQLHPDGTISIGSNTTAGRYRVLFFNPNGFVGSIATNGNIVQFNTSSDYRLKEDWVPMVGASERVLDLKPVNFAWKVDGSRVDGFLAHELQEVVPEAAHGTKDAMMDEEYEVTPAVLDDDGNVTTEAVMGTRSVPDYQGVDQSKLVPLLTAALQEALAEITSLKTRVQALEDV